MKTFNKLTAKQQRRAVEICTTDLLEGILSMGITFNDELNENDLQARINVACKRADDMQTPWFASEYIMDTCKGDITDMALCTAEEMLYAEQGEYVINGIA